MRRLQVTRVLVGAVVLPMLFATLVLWSLGDRVDRIDAVPAAVVNLDEPVTTGVGGKKQVIAAGRLLAAGLTTESQGPGDDQSGEDRAQTMDWRLTSQHEAEDGLRDGSYYAVLTIPADFSQTIADTTSGAVPGTPKAAEITVRSNDAASAVVGLLNEQIGDVAAARLNQTITASYLEGLYAQTGTLAASLGEAGQGAGELADGATRLGAGTAELSDGAGELAGGLGELSGGASRLTGGAAQLAGGAGRLTDGAGQLTGGAQRLASGTDDLATGLGTLHDRSAGLPDQTRRLADGADEVATGVDGWSQVLLGWKAACQADPVLAAGHARLCAGTVLATGPDGERARALTGGSRDLATGADSLADGTPALVGALDRSARGADRLATGADRLATGAADLGRGADALADGVRRLGAGAGELASGARAARDGAAELSGGSSELAVGSSRLSAGSRDLAEGLQQGMRQIPSYSAAERKELAAVVAEPVESTSSRMNPAPSTTSLVPGVLALALWLGAFVTYLVKQALPPRALRGATSPLRLTMAGFLPALGLAAIQAVMVFLALAPFDVVLDSPAAVGVFLLVPAGVFAAINQALVALSGPKRGWMISIAFAVLQAVALGGLVPIDTAPSLLQAVSGYLPVSLASEGISALALGGQVGSLAAATVALLVWGAGALAVTMLAARRRSRVTLSDVRRTVAVVPS